MQTATMSDIQEAAWVLQTYGLTALVWDFDKCPLKEVKQHYIPKGNEELVVVAHAEDKYISWRLIQQDMYVDEIQEIENRRIQLAFHEDYNLFIILNNETE